MCENMWKLVPFILVGHRQYYLRKENFLALFDIIMEGFIKEFSSGLGAVLLTVSKNPFREEIPKEQIFFLTLGNHQDLWVMNYWAWYSTLKLIKFTAVVAMLVTVSCSDYLNEFSVECFWVRDRPEKKKKERNIEKKKENRGHFGYRVVSQLLKVEDSSWHTN